MVSFHTALINAHTSSSSTNSPANLKAIQLPTFHRRSVKESNSIPASTSNTESTDDVVVLSVEEKAISRGSTESSVTITSSPSPALSVQMTEAKERKPVSIGIVPQVNNKYGIYDSDSLLPSSSDVVGVIPQVHGRDLPNQIHNNVVGVIPSGVGPLPKVASSFASGAVQKKEKVSGKNVKENKVSKKDAAVVAVIPLMKNGKYDEPSMEKKDVIGVVPFGEAQWRCDAIGVVPKDFAPLPIIPRAF